MNSAQSKDVAHRNNSSHPRDPINNADLKRSSNHPYRPDKTKSFESRAHPESRRSLDARDHDVTNFRARQDEAQHRQSEESKSKMLSVQPRYNNHLPSTPAQPMGTVIPYVTAQHRSTAEPMAVQGPRQMYYPVYTSNQQTAPVVSQTPQPMTYSGTAFQQSVLLNQVYMLPTGTTPPQEHHTLFPWLSSGEVNLDYVPQTLGELSAHVNRVDDSINELWDSIRWTSEGALICERENVAKAGKALKHDEATVRMTHQMLQIQLRIQDQLGEKAAWQRLRVSCLRGGNREDAERQLSSLEEELKRGEERIERNRQFLDIRDKNMAEFNRIIEAYQIAAEFQQG